MIKNEQLLYLIGWKGANGLIYMIAMQDRDNAQHMLDTLRERHPDRVFDSASITKHDFDMETINHDYDC